MKELNKAAPLGPEKPTAAQWLKNVDPKTWARSHFTNHYRCDVLVNNLNESLNADRKSVV